MRVCFLTEYFYPESGGGTPTVLSNLARYLRDHYPGLELEVVTSRNLYRGSERKLPPYEDWDGVSIYRASAPRSNQPSTLKRLAAGAVFTGSAFLKLMSRPRYDLLLVGTNPPTAPVAARLYRALRGTPYLYLVHDLYPDLAGALGVLRRESAVGRVFSRLQKGWLHGARGVIVIGRCMRDYLIRTYALPPERMDVITNWSDPDQIRPRDTDTRFRAANGLGGTVVLYAGNYGQYQNFDNILDAAKRLRGTHPEIVFAFVGDGARREYLARRIADEDITNARMFPFVPAAEFSDLLASADVSLVTLEPGAEGLGVPSKFYNILASGRPTVAIVSQDSEVARVLAEAECGIRVEQGDPAALAGVLGELSGSPERRAQLGRNARAVLEEKYTLEEVAARFYAVFQGAKDEPNGERRTGLGLGLRAEPPNAGYPLGGRTPNAGSPTPNTQHPTPNARDESCAT